MNCLYSQQKTRSLLTRGLIVLLLAIAGCKTTATTSTNTTYTKADSLIPIPWSEAPEALKQEHSLNDWADAIEASIGYYARKKPTAEVNFGTYKVSAIDMTRSLRKLANLARSDDNKALQVFLQENFKLFRSVGSNNQGNVLVTAYYEPLLQGSLQRSKRYKYPLYKRPKDIFDISLSPWLPEMKKKITARFDGKKLTPYYDREEIDIEKNLDKKNLELVWVDDLVDVFFLQIQGSGRVQLEEGGVIRVGYNGANGHPYRSIGKILIEEGAISREDMSLPAIRNWLDKNPSQQSRLLNANPSYVFFRKLKGGPYGNISVALTPERSIATDYRIFPKGAPGVLVTTIPNFSKNSSTEVTWQNNTRFIVNQDTGGAIRGPGRVDLFLGFGEIAEKTAGIMKQSGSALYFIAPTETANN
ncbi:MAG: murein transglycosylase A [Magnetococcales bacterium]|nr:murein transglycosylase A [Magnetococcales bacterium]